MSLGPKIVALLSPLVGGRVFPMVAPPNVLRPYITYQQFGGQALSFLDKTLPNKANGYIQINIWSETKAVTAALAFQVEALMIGATAFDCDAMSRPADDHEPDLNLYGSRQDFTVWDLRS